MPFCCAVDGGATWAKAMRSSNDEAAPELKSNGHSAVNEELSFQKETCKQTATEAKVNFCDLRPVAYLILEFCCGFEQHQERPPCLLHIMNIFAECLVWKITAKPMQNTVVGTSVRYIHMIVEKVNFFCRLKQCQSTIPK